MSAKPYIPRHSIYACYRDDAEPIKAPGFAAALRRHPRQWRKLATAAVAAGTMVFGAAEMAGAAFGSPNRHSAAGSAGESSALSSVDGAPFDATDLRWRKQPTSVQGVLTGSPVHDKNQAPATKATITGLAANGIPNVALNAYRVAAARLRHASPGCGIDWALLAAIGRVESDHGRFAGARLNADGTSTPRIIGPALDGTSSDYIPAPPNGMELAGDAVYAHALGPMQFIPSTWAIYGTDGNGDGKKDVFNVNDAALAAARYLCAAGGDLRTLAGQTTAILAYNHNDAYLAQVLALATAYRTGVPVTGVPVGDMTGPLPPLGSVGYVPPVNPGYPTAVRNSPRYSPHPTTTHHSTGTPGRTTPTGSTGSGSPGGGGGGGGGGGSSAPAPAPVPATPTSSSPAPNPVPIPIPVLPTSSAPAPAPTLQPTPSPTPTKSCTPLLHLLHLC